jgi:hypothetical protein
LNRLFNETRAPVLLGDQWAPTTVYMQVAGAGLKIDAKLFKRQVLQSPSLQVAAHAFFNQVVQHVKILDREGLQHLSCECYHVTKVEFDRLLGGVKAQSAACAHFHTLVGVVSKARRVGFSASTLPCALRSTTLRAVCLGRPWKNVDMAPRLDLFRHLPGREISRRRSERRAATCLWRPLAA